METHTNFRIFSKKQLTNMGGRGNIIQELAIANSSKKAKKGESYELSISN